MQDAIVNTFVNPQWGIGAVIRSCGSHYVVITGALRLGRNAAGNSTNVIDALDPLSAVRVFPDFIGADIHARMVVFGEIQTKPVVAAHAVKEAM
jgi:hypothetical protein